MKTAASISKTEALVPSSPSPSRPPSSSLPRFRSPMIRHTITKTMTMTKTITIAIAVWMQLFLFLLLLIAIDPVQSFPTATTLHGSFSAASALQCGWTPTRLCASFMGNGNGNDPNKRNGNNRNSNRNSNNRRNSNSNSNSSKQSDRDALNEIRERQVREALMEDVLLSQGSRPAGTDSQSAFVSLSLVGQGRLPLAASIAKTDGASESESVENKNNSKPNRRRASAPVLVLAPESRRPDATEPTPAVFVPLTAPIDARLRLLCKAYEARPVSSLTSLVLWNLNLVNRDDASLFDNIPWNTWSRDPHLKNRDAAGNLGNERSRYGKRDAYNRFLGKDANSRTVTESQRRYWERKLRASVSRGEASGGDELADGATGQTAGNNGNDDDDRYNDNDNEENDENEDAAFSLSFLSKRVLELRIRELRMEIAEVDSELAIARNNNLENDSRELQDTRNELEQNLGEAETNLNELLSSMSSQSSQSQSSSSPTGASSSGKDEANFFEKIARFALDLSMSYRTEQREAPYRGATGYAPRLSDVADDSDVAFYRSPYDLLNEILSDQLNAEVIGCALENTSWLGGTLTMGGAVVLRRRTPVVETTLMGETVRTLDRDQDFGNAVRGGEVFVVDCDPDEAIGVALSCDLPVRVERTVFERSAIVGVPVEEAKQTGGGNNDANPIAGKWNLKRVLPVWKATDSGLSLHVEGDGTNRNAERLSPISIPRTTSSLFDSVFDSSANRGEDEGDGDGENRASSSSSSMFPTDNPIKSIGQWDGLTDADKAKTLLEMSNFSGRLPRPRTVRKASPDDGNPLDKLLMPLIDESVRSEYRIREAERTGDLELATELRANKSKLQVAREKVDAARREGNEDLANQWDEEAAFLETLRADVTQDDGAYSRFLDRDDWYERDRRKTAARVKKSSFGNLLDGIE